jgi:hypothetical protein
MSIWKQLFGTKKANQPEIWDMRSESDKRAEVEARSGLGGEDEQLARQILSFQKQRGTQDSPNRQPDNPDNDRKEAEAAIRKIGEHLGAHGGSDRMVRVAYRVKALGGSSRQLEWCWEGICGWLA